MSVRRSRNAQSIAELANWARGAGNAQRDYNYFATVTTATASGALLPVRVLGSSMGVPTWNGFRRALEIVGASTIVTDGDDVAGGLNFPVGNIGAGAEIIEGSTDGSIGTDDADVPGIALPARSFSSGYHWVSNQLLNVGLDVEQFVDTELRRIKELALERAIAQDIAATVLTATKRELDTAGEISAADLLGAKALQPARYRQQRAIILSPSAFDAAEALDEVDGSTTTPGVIWHKSTPIISALGFAELDTAGVVGCVMSGVGFRLRDIIAGSQIRRHTDAAHPDQTALACVGYHAFGWVPASMVLIVNPDASEGE